jgi:tetratricopeptide (TPR) repeat protein
MLENIATEKRHLMVLALESALANHFDWSLLVQQDLYPQPNLPISKKWSITRRDTATRLIRNGSPESIRSVLLIDPAHPLLQIALAGLNEYARQAEFLREFGVTSLPNDVEFCRDAAEMLMKLNDRPRAMRAVEKAIQLDPNNPDTIRLRKIIANE